MEGCPECLLEAQEKVDNFSERGKILMGVDDRERSGEDIYLNISRECGNQ